MLNRGPSVEVSFRPTDHSMVIGIHNMWRERYPAYDQAVRLYLQHLAGLRPAQRPRDIATSYVTGQGFKTEYGLVKHLSSSLEFQQLSFLAAAERGPKLLMLDIKLPAKLHELR